MVTSVRGTRNFVGGLTVIVGLAALGLEACSGNGASEDLGSVAQPVYDFDEDAGIFQSTPVDPQLRAQVVVSLWKPGKWSQAGASNQGDGCSGILVTPRAVLTAASCAKRLNTTSFDVFVGPRTPDVAAPGETVKFQSESIVSFGTPASEPSLSGRDVAIVFLKTPVLEAAFIHRPPLSTPSALSGPDSDGGSPYAVGISGWSPFTAVPGLNDPPAATVRQTFFKDSVGGNDEIRLTWHSGLPLWSATAFRPVTGLPKVGPAPGDNGGPLFVHGPSDRLDVIGVASVIGAPADPLLTPSYDWAALPARQQELCQTPASAPSPPDITPYDCIFWVDVTSEPVKGWLLSTLVDTTRGPDWLKSHPRVGEGQSGLPWIGEVDYTGPCQQSADADCDHVYTSNADGSRRDNCPTLANPDQKDSLDLGVGDACVAGQTLTLTDGGVSQVLNEPVGVMRTSGGSIVIADWGNNDVSYMQTPASSPQTWLRGSRNRISNPRAEVAGAGVPGWIIASGSWSIGTRSNCASPCQFSPFDGAAWFNGVRGAAALGRMTQTLNLVDQASFISTGVMRAVISANVQVPMGAARLLVEYLDFAGAVIGTYDSGAISAVAAPSWTPIENEHAVPTAARAARIALEVPSGRGNTCTGSVYKPAANGLFLYGEYSVKFD